jgi:2,5-diketo-D-gluconate reductase A
MTQTVPLAGGVAALPMIGFGTWQLRGRSAYDAVRHALDVGYRHLDTATMYGNEAEVGRALRDSGVPRSEVFVTTKLPPERAGQEQATLAASLRALGLDQLDLWLIHWPPRGQALVPTWDAFRSARDSGQVRAIGVSNYSIAQLDELISVTGEAPAVNQIPWDPAGHDPAHLAASRERGVLVEGYSPLKRSNLADPTLAAIAERHGVSVPQVILRWHLEHGIPVIPKSANKDRIESNFALSDFALDADEVTRIDNLS